ncbi:hypothetical protein OIU77_030078 [Salix suchowensis]|uniref:PROTEIN ROUGH SHEATH 2-like protein n=2 Tax=Salix TaxID=40685 RepID=A0A9Q0T331_SALPP|nr:hypothetical protein OIU77_030078 [Salix suchowensis]KAJ6699589.1 PROTEIN ROUGH SHEATH 2-like protein [Salix purpurea]
MKERQRWRAEEDALLRAYVKQYGPREWNLVSQRMNTPLNRDAKSCLERWKNYLKPGIKKGSLTEEEQSLVIRLQAKHGNKWKKIAAEVPGRTAKRLGKWWEVFKEKQQRELKENNKTVEPIDEGNTSTVRPPSPSVTLSLSPSTVAASPPIPWLQPERGPENTLVLGNLPPHGIVPVCGESFLMSELVDCCRELEEGHRAWAAHKKEAAWRLRRVELQLESEKSSRRREKMEEIESKIKSLREEEKASLDRIEAEYREQLAGLRRDAENKEQKLSDQWAAKHSRLTKFLEQMSCRPRLSEPNSR